MGSPADEDAARRDRLELWAEEQADLAQRRRKLPERDKLPARIADWFMDRGLNTRGSTYEREHLGQDRLQYVPSSWGTLPRVLRHTGVARDGTFIDFGCGKGRVVHQAAKRPFRKVIGIEISPPLAAAAQATVDAGRDRYRCKDVEIVVADASEYRVPDDLAVAYFFHPFYNEAFDIVLADIVGSFERNPRELFLVYCFPLRSEQIEATGRFELVKQLRGGLRRAAGRLYSTQIWQCR